MSVILNDGIVICHYIESLRRFKRENIYKKKQILLKKHRKFALKLVKFTKIHVIKFHKINHTHCYISSNFLLMLINIRFDQNFALKYWLQLFNAGRSILLLLAISSLPAQIIFYVLLKGYH